MSGSFINLSIDVHTHTHIYMQHLQQNRACHSIFQSLIISVELFRISQQYLGGRILLSLQRREKALLLASDKHHSRSLNLQGHRGVQNSREWPRWVSACCIHCPFLQSLCPDFWSLRISSPPEARRMEEHLLFFFQITSIQWFSVSFQFPGSISCPFPSPAASHPPPLCPALVPILAPLPSFSSSMGRTNAFL